MDDTMRISMRAEREGDGGAVRLGGSRARPSADAHFAHRPRLCTVLLL
jgi:hypothetical protein